MALVDVGIALSAKDGASAVIANVNKELGNTAKHAVRTSGGIKNLSGEFRNAVTPAASAVRAMSAFQLLPGPIGMVSTSIIGVGSALKALAANPFVLALTGAVVAIAAIAGKIREQKKIVEEANESYKKMAQERSRIFAENEKERLTIIAENSQKELDTIRAGDTAAKGYAQKRDEAYVKLLNAQKNLNDYNESVAQKSKELDQEKLLITAKTEEDAARLRIKFSEERMNGYQEDTNEYKQAENEKLAAEKQLTALLKKETTTQTKDANEAVREQKQVAVDAINEELRLLQKRQDAKDEEIRIAEGMRDVLSERRAIIRSGMDEETALLDEMAEARFLSYQEGTVQYERMVNRQMEIANRLMELEAQRMQAYIDLTIQSVAQIASLADQYFSQQAAQEQKITQAKYDNLALQLKQKANSQLVALQGDKDYANKSALIRDKLDKTLLDMESDKNNEMDDLRREEFDRQKAMQLLMITINTASAIMAALTDPILGIPKSIAAGITGAIQFGIAASASYQADEGFGSVVPGSRTTPVPAILHGGETVSRGNGGGGYTIVVQGDVYGWDESMDRINNGLFNRNKLSGGVPSPFIPNHTHQGALAIPSSRV